MPPRRSGTLRLKSEAAGLSERADEATREIRPATREGDTTVGSVYIGAMDLRVGLRADLRARRVQRTTFAGSALACALSLLHVGCAGKQPYGDLPAPDPVPEGAPEVRAFQFRVEVALSVPPPIAYVRFTEEIGEWWDHSFAERPIALVFEPALGGRFYEIIDERGSVAEHARIFYVEPGSVIRFAGPLGFSGLPVELVHTLRFQAKESGSVVTLDLAGTGPLAETDIAAIKAVWEHFLVERYVPYVESKAKVVAAPQGSEVPVYQQLPPKKSRDIGFGFFSHVDRGKARNHIHADDFRLPAAASVSRIAWWGMTEGTTDPATLNVEDFTVRVHASRDGEPAAVVCEQNFPVANLAIQPTKRYAPKGAERSRGEEHRFEAKLRQPCELAADTTYFVSIMAHRRDPMGDAWQWSDSIAANKIAFSHPFADPSWTRIVDADSTFALYADAVEVPAPAPAPAP